MKLHLLATTALVFGSVGSAHAYTYFDSFNVPATMQNDGADTGNGSSANYDGVIATAQSFFAPASGANSVTLYLSDPTGATDGGSVKVYLYADPGTTSGVPTAQSSFSAPTGTFSGQSIGIIPDTAIKGSAPTGVTLNFVPNTASSNNEYWIEAASNNAEFWYEKGSAGTGLSNQSSWFYSTTNSTGNLRLDSETNPYEMVVAGTSPSTTVPEPASAAVLASGLVGAGVLRRRSRRPA